MREGSLLLPLLLLCLVSLSVQRLRHWDTNCSSSYCYKSNRWAVVDKPNDFASYSPFLSFPPQLNEEGEKNLKYVVVVITTFLSKPDKYLTNNVPPLQSVGSELCEWGMLVGRLRVILVINDNPTFFEKVVESLSRTCKRPNVEWEAWHVPPDEGVIARHAWGYRPILTQLIKNEWDISTFVVMEDDILFPVDSLASWANEVDWIDNKGFTRGLTRLDFPCWSRLTPKQSQMDMVNITLDGPRFVHSEWGKANKTKINLPLFSAMFILTRKQMLEYKSSKIWQIKFEGMKGIREAATLHPYRWKFPVLPFVGDRVSAYAFVFHLREPTRFKSGCQAAAINECQGVRSIEYVCK